jgi:hypothetical protein
MNTVTKFEDYTDVFNSIDWNKVGDEIKRVLDINTTLEFTQRSKYVNMTSDNLINQCGIFNRAISKCYLTFFSNRLFMDNGEDYKFWAIINLSYPGNGMTIATVWVMDDNTIKVEVNEPR